jgi:hypothetical protein
MKTGLIGLDVRPIVCPVVSLKKTQGSVIGHLALHVCSFQTKTIVILFVKRLLNYISV